MSALCRDGIASRLIASRLTESIHRIRLSASPGISLTDSYLPPLKLHIQPEAPCAHNRVVKDIFLFGVETVGVKMLPGVKVITRGIHAHLAHPGLAAYTGGKCISDFGMCSWHP